MLFYLVPFIISLLNNAWIFLILEFSTINVFFFDSTVAACVLSPIHFIRRSFEDKKFLFVKIRFNEIVGDIIF